jgi:alkylation response protein AidB-like acyl-CoA dehydrogenase
VNEYQAPLADMRFLLREWDAGDAAGAAPVPEVADAVLEAAARFAAGVLRPLNRRGDEEGCVLDDGKVRTPHGFAPAFRAYADGGWAALAGDPTYGGQGLPHRVRILVDEMWCAANLSFASYTLLLQGAFRAIHAHGDEAQKRLYLPRIAAGEWAASMCLTEDRAGTDLGLLRTRAEPDAGGTYRVTGSKIFITAGEHDLAANIVHLVLARLPGAPAGTRGISLFVVPARLPDAQGRAGARNRIACRALEAKMGQNASATCALEFDGATGWLLGRPHVGLAAMFSMLNTIRLSAGMQGLGIAEAACQQSLAYARQRRQGRAPGAPHGDEAADAIGAHPDVKRMLLTQRANIEGMRALAQWVASAFDASESHPDPATRAAALERVSLMTPVVKALFTDLGFECANLGLQVYGGHGYMRANGMEQYVRDIRVAQIYDGTNAIQGLDLVRRKLAAEGLARRFFDPLDAVLSRARAELRLAELAEPLAAARDRLRRTTDWIVAASRDDPAAAAGVATEYLRQFGLVALGAMWASMATAALPRLAGDSAGFYRAKLFTARFFMARLLPQEEALAKIVLAPRQALADFDPDAL